MYELWQVGGSDAAADELAHAQDWTPPNTCHTQNTRTQENTFSKFEKKEEKIDANGHSILDTIEYLLHTKYESSRKDIFKIWKKRKK